MRVYCKRDKYRYIRLPVKFVNDRFNINHNTNFCVDTGAPYSLISLSQAITWQIPFDQLRRTEATHKVVGCEGYGYYLEDSKILLRDWTGILYPVEIPRIVVLGPDFHKTGLPVPALFGDDILRNFTLIVKSDQRGGDSIITDEDVDISPRLH